jgi:hypothetical protein
MKTLAASDVHIHRIKDIVPSTEGHFVIKAEALVSKQRTELEIAITADLAPAMALALLATTAQARAVRDDMEPALDVLGAAVVPSGNDERVRIQLLFDKGAVLPLEMTMAAGSALTDGLVQYMKSLSPAIAQEHKAASTRPSRLDD